MSIEFCPRCGYPLEANGDPGRLCSECGWFGDESESAKQPPPTDMLNPGLAAVQGLWMFREVCRNEMVVETLCDFGQATEADMRKLRAAVKHAMHGLIELLLGLRAKVKIRPKQRIERVNGLVAWPQGWTDYHHNASREPCDMLVGPCSCGAWHTEDEPWVQDTLNRHNAEIADA